MRFSDMHVHSTFSSDGKSSMNKVITDEEKRLVELMARHQEQLSSFLKNNELVVFEKYIDCFTEYTSLIECQAFEIGFKLAVKMLKNN
ncbi:DUF6809 family protein [Eubacterium coprostanoligenes]|uniref:DUF6809 family protein n=2 Tax=Eubacterium TaxID=1730 RepID=UPI002A7FB034|nr:DUF6809 family protein [Eubacterium coprostanoligenes]MDY4699192.1 hypothetical protein [Eubacterium coprostanoligenes]